MKRALILLIPIAATCALAQSRLDVLRGDASSQDFMRALQPRSFEFPLDHGPHPEFRHEWWYFTGQLEAPNGEHFGFELTFFRYALAPAKAQATLGSEWRASEIYMAHFAITDLSRRQLSFAERYSRAAVGLAGAQAQPLRVWLEDWKLQQTAAGWILDAASGRHALHLQLQPSSSPVLNGENGLSRKSAAAASYYYSVPRIAATGQLTRDGVELQVMGTAWLDREWGSGALAPDQQGWDWFALELDDGSALMFYMLRKRDGSRDAYSAGTWIDVTGHTRHLTNDELKIDVLDHWQSPRGGRYPARWRLRSEPLALNIEVRPLLADQELLTHPRYWEGAVGISGRRGGQAAGGRGYVELVGYAK